MATKKIKINFKMPTPTAAERLHAQQQKNRKAAGLPDASEYKKKLDAMKSEEVEQLDEYESKDGVYKHTAKYVPTDRNEVTYREPHTAGRKLNKSRTSDSDRSLGVKWGNGALYKAQSKKTLLNVHKNLPEEVELLDEMPESNMKVRDVHSHLKKAGWALARSSGGHDVFKHPKAKHSIPVPRHSLKAPLVRGILKASKVEEQLEKKGRFVSGPVKQPFKSDTIVTSVKEAKDSQEYDYEGDMAKSDLRSIMHHAKELHDMIEDNTNLAEWCQSKITLAEDYLSTVANYMRSEMNEEVQLDEKKNLPGLWANIHAKRKRGEPPAKPGDKDYPKTLNIESAAEPTEGEMKGKQGYSRKAQIVRDAAKGKKSDSPDKFQKDPELSSEIHKT